MPQFTIIQTHKVSGAISVIYWPRVNEPDIIELSIGSTKLRMTIAEFDYVCKEVDRARPHS